MRLSERPRTSPPGRMKVTTLNLMTTCRAKVTPPKCGPGAVVDFPCWPI
jgi:hypothetical protein